MHVNRLPGLDLLRAIAIIWVMLYHVTSWGAVLPRFAEYGFIGVDLFFVLSGFLIGWQILKPYTVGTKPAWCQFFVRRAFRVLPAYWCVLLLYWAVPALRESPNIQPLWQFLTFSQNLFADYFHARAFSHAWSLCVEEHFYLLLPPLVWLLARKPNAGKVAAVFLLMLIGGMLLRSWLWLHEVEPFLHIRTGEGNFLIRYIENIYNPTYCRLDGLLAGVMLATVKCFRPVWWSGAMESARWFFCIGLLGIVAALSLPAPGYLSAVFGFPLLSFSLAAVVLAAASSNSGLWRWRVPGAAPIAVMAFSLYLSHKMVYYLLNTYVIQYLPDSNMLRVGLYIGGALATGALLYLTVERPGLKLRERWTKTADYPNTAGETAR